MSEPAFDNNDEKLEVILDIDCDAWGELSLGGIQTFQSAVHRFTYSQLNSSDSVVLRFNHVAINSPIGDNLVDVTKTAELIKILITDYGTVSLDLGKGYTTDCDSSAAMEKAFKDNENQSKITSVEITDWGCSSIQFVQYLKNLVHLDLSWVDLHGKLGTLKHMQRGLLFLRLVDCSLNNEDLAQLMESCHQETLKELDFEYNDFSYDANFNNLIRLCQNLTNVLILKLCCCGLSSWPINEMKLLVYSLKQMPHIVNLDLSGNGFVLDIIRVHVLVLHENLSLRLLKLSLPTDNLNFLTPNLGEQYISEIKSFLSTINGKINIGRPQVLYIRFE
ncbi:unnamed protein product [Meganyctiphanes norvegica]|uniref:Uncharacterized protein n=1 Tax=Meganyctiphanes norvegica TaxID=48144 RepID=A0AAV2RAV0_MEGNR